MKIDLNSSVKNGTLMELWNFVVSCVLAFVMAFKKQFPDAYMFLEEHYLKLAWGGTKSFTMAQQFVKRNGIDKLWNTEKQAKRVTFVKNGRSVDKTDEYDFILFDILDQQSNKYNRKRFKSFDDIVEFEMSGESFSSSEGVRFLGLQVHQKESGKKFELTLNDNYLIEGNVLFDLPMIKFLLREHHNTSLLDDDVYEVTFIDNDMNVQTFSNDQHIIIESNGYKVV